jgi:predicted patatin/cPLA2 family phospholipase
MRVLRGKPVIDVNDVLSIISPESVAGQERVTSGSVLHCVAVDVDSARPVDLHGMRTQDDVWKAILASSRMPWAGGPPVEIDGRRYLDGGMASPIPVAEALAAGATHVLALQTRPFGIPRKSASRVGDRLIERHLRGLNPALVKLYRDRIEEYERLVADLEQRSRDHAGGPPYVLGLRPPAGTPCIGQLERNPQVLSVGAADGERLVEAALSGRLAGV